MIWKKIVSLLSIAALVVTTAAPAITAAQAIVPMEYRDSVEFMMNEWLTSATSYETYSPNNALTREQGAALFERFYTNVLGKTEKDGNARCSFADASEFDPTLVSSITNACEFGLMWVGITSFNPKVVMTRGEVLTVMSRMLYGNEHNGGTPFWANHEQALFDAGIVNMRHPQANANGSTTRIVLALMLYRTSNMIDDIVDPELCEDPVFAILCEDPTDPVDPVDPITPNTGTNYDDTNRPVSNGALTLSATSKLANGSSIPNNGVVTFANMTLTAQSDDVMVYGIKVMRGGLGQRSEIKRVFFEVDGRRISSYSALNPDNTAEITFSQPIVVKANGSAMMDFVVEIESANAGGEHMFEVLAIDTNATSIVGVGLKTNTYRTTTYQTIKVGFEGLSTDAAYSAGETTNLKFGQFKLTNQSAANEDKDVMVKTIVFRNDGDGDAMRNLTNIKVVQNGKVVSKEVVHDGKSMSVIFDNYLLKANQTPVFELVADVAYVDNTDGDTYNFRIQRTQDVVATEVATDFRSTIEFLWANLGDLKKVTVRGGDIMLRNIDGFNRSMTTVIGARQVALAKWEITARQSVMLENAQNIKLKITKSNPTAFVTTKTEAETVIQRIELKVGTRSIVWVIKDGWADHVLVDFDGTFTIQALQPIEVLVDIKSTAGAAFRNAVIELPEGLWLASFEIAEYTANGNNVTTGLVGALSSARLTLQDAGLSMARTDGFAITRNVVDGATNVPVFTATLSNTSDLPVTITQLVFEKTAAYTFNGDVVATITSTGWVSRSLTFKATDTNLDFNSINIVVAKGQPVTVRMTADFEAWTTKVWIAQFKLKDFLGQDANGTVYNKDNATSMTTFESARIDVKNSAANAWVTTFANNRSNFIANSSQQVTLGAVDISASQWEVRLKDLVVIASNDTAVTGWSVYTTLDDYVSNVSLYRKDGTLVQNWQKVLVTSTAGNLPNFMSGNAVQAYRFENMQNVSIMDGNTETFEVRATINNINDVANTDVKFQLHIPGNITINANAMKGIVLEQSNGTQIDITSLVNFGAANVLTIGKVNTIVQWYPVVAKATYTPDGIGSLRVNVTATNGRILLQNLNFLGSTAPDLNVKIYANSVNANNVVYAGNINENADLTLAKGIANTSLNGQEGYSINAGTTTTFIVEFDNALPVDQTRTVRLTDVTYEDVIGGTASAKDLNTAGKENVGELPVTETYSNK